MGSQATGAVASAIESPRPMTRFTPRVLAADDQPDVLEALRPAAEAGRLRARDRRRRRRASLAAAEQREFDVLLIDLNYTRDTTSGQRGPGPAEPAAGARRHAAGGRDDRLGQRRRSRSRRCAAARATSCRSRGTTRGSSRSCAPRSSSARALRRGQRLEAENLALRDVGRPLLIAESAGDAAGARADRAGRAVGRERADHRRERHRQGQRSRARCTRSRRAPASRS